MKVKSFMNMLIKEYGHTQSKEIFINECMEELDKFGKKYGFEEIFHLTADEVDCEGNNIIDFLNSIDFGEVRDDKLKEILKYLSETMEEDKNKLPRELLKDLSNNI